MANGVYLKQLSEIATGTQVTDDAGAVKNAMDVFVRNDVDNPLNVSGTFSSTNSANEAVGDPIPGEATLVGFEDPSGNIAPGQVTAGGELLISSTTLATEATLDALNDKVPATLGQKAMAASLAVVLASDQSAVPVSGPLTDTQLRATAVPVSAASLPLPTGAATEATLAAQSAKLPASLGQKTEAASLSVVLASDQPAVPVSIGANTSSFAEITNLTTSAQTFTAPAGAIGFKIQSPSTNAEHILWKVGAAATTTSGILMEPGRSEDLNAGGDISVIAAAGTNQVVFVQWVIA